jgi:CRISPR/Cas system-associated endonuclease Cas1
VNPQQSIINIIKKTKDKSFEKLYCIITYKYPNITSIHLKDIITHNIKIHFIHNSKYFIQIFTNQRYSCQMNIIINTLNDYLVFISINTLFAVLKSIHNRLTTSMLNAIKSIFKKLKIKHLESDEKCCFVSKRVLKYLKKKDVDYYIISE